MYGDSYDRWAAAGDDESIKKWIEDTGLTPEENYKVRAFDGQRPRLPVRRWLTLTPKDPSRVLFLFQALCRAALRDDRYNDAAHKHLHTQLQHNTHPPLSYRQNRNQTQINKQYAYPSAQHRLRTTLHN